MEIKIKKQINAKEETMSINSGIKVADLCKLYENELPYTVLAARINNKIEDLNYILNKPCSVEFLDMRTQAANLIYQHSLTLIYLKALETVLGRTSTDIQNSLNKGLFTRLHRKIPITEEDVERIEEEMREIVSKDIPFEKIIMKRNEAFDFLEKAGLMEKKRLLEEAKEVESVSFYSLEGFKNFFYGKMVPSTGYIKKFQLVKYKAGILVRFPHPSDPSKLPNYVDETKMYEAFKEATKWQKLLDISYVSDLNEKVHKGEFREIVQLSEALHEKKIVEIAEDITLNNKRIILIAGPSSSGKTTFARRLCVQLKVNGLKPLYMGTDDYFVERNKTPLDENGEYDFENLSAVDIDLFNNNINDLLAGKEVDLPEFDFLKGSKNFGKRITSIKKNQPIVIEGIHALNDELTFHLKDELKYKIYISPLTQLNIDSHNRIPTTDARMIRRMVRDYKYRGHTAQGTIKEWPKVRAGEDKNIFPYSGKADAFFNSAHIYELSVLKKYAEPLLQGITQDEREYGEAKRILKFLEFFEIVEDDSIILNNSILREFIGGSVFID